MGFGGGGIVLSTYGNILFHDSSRLLNSNVLNFRTIHTHNTDKVRGINMTLLLINESERELCLLFLAI